MVPVHLPVPVGSQRAWPLCCWCEGSSCPWNECLPWQVYLPLFAIPLISFHRAFDRLLANASSSNQDFSLSLLPVPAPLVTQHQPPPARDLDRVRPHCSSQAEMKQPQTSHTGYYSSLYHPHFLHLLAIFLWIWTLHIVFIQEDWKSTVPTPPAPLFS